jgi:hypothetical protein
MPTSPAQPQAASSPAPAPVPSPAPAVAPPSSSDASGQSSVITITVADMDGDVRNVEVETSALVENVKAICEYDATCCWTPLPSQCHLYLWFPATPLYMSLTRAHCTRVRTCMHVDMVS